MVGISCGMAVAAVAGDVVHWNGNYLADGYTGSLYLDRGEAVPLATGKVYPDLETAKSPRSPKYDQSLPSAIFYGALETTSAMPVAVEKSRMQIRHEGGENCLSIGSDPGAVGNTVIARGLIVWKSDGFLGKFAGRDISKLSDLTEMTLVVSGVRGSASARFAVMSAGKWYFSETVIEGKSDGPEPKTFGEFSLKIDKSAWGEVAGGPPGEVPSDYRVGGPQLRDISAIGFYFEAEYRASNAAMFEVNSFRVSTGD